MSLNAYQVQALKDLGVDVGSLGCVMLDLEPPFDLAGIIPEQWAYHSKNPELSHVSGIQTEHHMTLLYGLLSQVRGSHVDEVMEDWEIPYSVKTDFLDVFPSPLPDEPYSCIVASQTSPSREIKDAHARLSLLPHINTHPVFKAHVTLAYVHRNRTEEARNRLLSAFGDYVPILWRTNWLNYGQDMLP